MLRLARSAATVCTPVGQVRRVVALVHLVLEALVDVDLRCRDAERRSAGGRLSPTISYAEMQLGYPPQFTLIPTTSAGAKKRRQASAVVRAPGQRPHALRHHFAARLASLAVLVVVSTHLSDFTVTTRPGNGPGMPGVAAGAYRVTIFQRGQIRPDLPPIGWACDPWPAGPTPSPWRRRRPQPGVGQTIVDAWGLLKMAGRDYIAGCQLPSSHEPVSSSQLPVLQPLQFPAGFQFRVRVSRFQAAAPCPCFAAFPGEIAAANREPRTANREPRTANREPRTANCEPRTANRELRTANREPRTANCEPRTANRELRTANCEPRTANCEPRTANCELKSANREPRTANREPANPRTANPRTREPANPRLLIREPGSACPTSRFMLVCARFPYRCEAPLFGRSRK